MFYYNVNGSWMAKILDGFPGDEGSNLNTNNCILVVYY